MKKDYKFDHKKLAKWINGDPYREAKIIDEVPMKNSTLQKTIKGHYKPSERLGRAIERIMKDA